MSRMTHTKGFGLMHSKATPVNEAMTTGTKIDITKMSVAELNHVASKFFGKAATANKISSIKEISTTNKVTSYTVEISDPSGKVVGTEVFRAWTVMTFDRSVHFNLEIL